MSYEGRDTYATYHNKFGDGPGPYLMGANTLTGNDVFNHKFEGLGNIKEFMLNMKTGEVSYAVLSFGGILGIGEKLFAVPFKALELDTKNKRFILNIEKNKIQNAPGFDTEHWPNMADETWGDSIHDFYNKACQKE
jgi:sporulation protein YlmC with PRC-barrel domain